MDYSEKVNGVSIVVQAQDGHVGEKVTENIKKIVGRLSRYYEKIEKAEVFLENKPGKSTNSKKISIRLSIPGNDAFASGYGNEYNALLRDVEEKLRRQLEKK